MKFNKKVITFIAICIISLSGTSIYASGVFDNLFPDIEPQYQEEVQEVQNKLENSWITGKEKILTELKPVLRVAEGSSSNDWRLIDVVRLEENLLNSFSEAEKSSFMDAFYSEERKRNLEVGDLMPALLISPDQTEAKQFWEKHNGSYIVIDLKSKEVESSNREWFVDGSALRLQR